MICLSIKVIEGGSEKHGDEVCIGIRPEKIEISKKNLDGFSNCLTGVIQSIVYQGRFTQYNVRLENGHILQVFEQNEKHFQGDEIDYNDKVYIYWQKENAMLLKNK